jgi:hopanoid biosynthesis associated protein HpnK
VRRLIVNADDFGLTAGVNRGIVQSHQNGIVTSTTLMACSQRFTEAATLAKDLPRLSVGCHVVLVDGTPTADPAQIPTLLGPGTPAQFRVSLMNFAVTAASGRLDEAQVETEITAQIQKLQSKGVAVSHLDSHKHAHMFPVVLRGMLRAAKICGVKAIRNPFEPLVFAKFARWKRQFQLRMMSNFRKNFRRALESAEIATPDGCIGVAATGGLNQETFGQLIEGLPEGTWEFVSHPGYNDQELDTIATRLRESREKEMAVLTSPATKELLLRHQVELISYREL